MAESKTEKRERARELRRMGWAYSQIVEELEVAKSSVSLWCRDIELSTEQESAIRERALIEQKRALRTGNRPEINRQIALEQRRRYQAAGREMAREGRFLHIIGCMLYWAEGAKHNRNKVDFANADPHMMTLFMRFLREELEVKEDKLHLQIHCYAQDEDEIKRIEDYWLDLLNVSRSALYATQILTNQSSRRNRLTNGVCSIRVSSTELLMHILGAIQEYGGFDNPDWLV